MFVYFRVMGAAVDAIEQTPDAIYAVCHWVFVFKWKYAVGICFLSVNLR